MEVTIRCNHTFPAQFADLIKNFLGNKIEMYEYKYSIRDVCITSVETMGNLIDTSLFSDSKDNSANPVNILSAIMSSTFWGNPNQSENIQAWYACIDDIDSVNEDNLLVKSLRPEELQKVKRFRFPEDQKRALLSILLQRTLIRERFKIHDSEYELIRSKEGKPLVKSTSTDIDFNTWNFNVSHHGKYVCIVSHQCLLMGADIVDLSARSNMPCSGAMEYIEMFESQLTALEVRDIQRQPTETARYCYFYLIWSLKEAFIKAIGQGLGFDLTQVEFSIVFEPGCDLHSQIDADLDKKTCQDSSAAATGSSSSSHCDVWVKGFATVRLRGELRDDWRMEFASLDSKHVMSVARGPLSAALPTFVQQAGWRLPVSAAHSPSAADHKHGFNATSTVNKLGEKEISSQHQAHLALPMPACLRKTLSDLTPPTSITATDTTSTTTTSM